MIAEVFLMCHSRIVLMLQSCVIAEMTHYNSVQVFLLSPSWVVLMLYDCIERYVKCY